MTERQLAEHLRQQLGKRLMEEHDRQMRDLFSVHVAGVNNAAFGEQRTTSNRPTPAVTFESIRDAMASVGFDQGKPGGDQTVFAKGYRDEKGNHRVTHVHIDEVAHWPTEAERVMNGLRNAAAADPDFMAQPTERERLKAGELGPFDASSEVEYDELVCWPSDRVGIRAGEYHRVVRVQKKTNPEAVDAAPFRFYVARQPIGEAI